MKRKNLNAAKLKNVIIKDKKISSIYLRLKSILSKQKKNNLIAVAVSGGPDSMALALLTKTLMYERKYKVHFLLVDHGIRKNSTKEALNVKSILEKKEIKLKVLKNYKKISSNIQKNARDIRYNLLIEYCKKNKIKSILTAHHKEDQIETFLIRLSRGSGVEGLSSMSQSIKLKYGIKLIRPFLDFKKNEINQVSRKFLKNDQRSK